MKTKKTKIDGCVFSLHSHALAWCHSHRMQTLIALVHDQGMHDFLHQPLLMTANFLHQPLYQIPDFH